MSAMTELNKEHAILRRTLLDPNYDLSTDNYRIIDDVYHFLEKYNKVSCRPWDGKGLVDLMLLRVRNCSPHVYAITVGQFPGFEELEDKWDADGMTDPDGYLWLKPR